MNVDQRKAFWEATGIDSPDLVIALAVATTSAEVWAISGVTNLLKGTVYTHLTSRPTTPGPAQGRWDFEVVLINKLRALEAAERPEDEIQAARTRKQMQDDESERARLSQKQAYQVARYQDRLAAGQYTTPWERERAARHA